MSNPHQERAATGKARKKKNQGGSWRWIFAAICFCYLYCFPYFEQLNSPAENARLYAVKAMVEHHSFAVDRVLNATYPRVVDLSARDGHYYSCKAPGTSLLGVPVLFIAGAGGQLSKAAEVWLLRTFVSIIPSLLFLYFFGRFIRQRCSREYLANLVLLGLALGSMFYTYGILFFGHGQAAVSLFGCFLIAQANKRRGQDATLSLIAAGFLLALCVACEYQAVIPAVFVAAYLWHSLRKKRSVQYVLLGALLPVVMTALYHYESFGSVFMTGHHYLVHERFRDFQYQWLWGLFFFRGEALWGTLVSPRNGLWFFAPWLAFALPGVWCLFRQKGQLSEALCATLVIVSNLTVVVGMFAWKGGWSVGPRYLTVSMPFMAYAACAFLEWAAARWRYFGYLFVPALVVSIIVCATATVTFPHLPEDIANPVFEFLWPLVHSGYVAHNAGQFLGLCPQFSALPYAMVVGVLLWYAVVGFARSPAKSSRRWGAVARLVSVALISVAAFYFMALSKTVPNQIVQTHLAWAKRIWQPLHDGATSSP